MSLGSETDEEETEAKVSLRENVYRQPVTAFLRVQLKLF